MQDIQIQNANNSEALTIALKKITTSTTSSTIHNEESNNINNNNKIIIPDFLNLLQSKYSLYNKSADCACAVASAVSFLISKENNINRSSPSMKTAAAFRDLLFRLVDDLESSVLLDDNCVQSISSALLTLYTTFRDQTNSNKALVTAADDEEKTRTAFCKLAVVNALSAQSITFVCKWMSNVLLDNNKTRSDDDADDYYSNIKLSLNRKRIFSHPDVVNALIKLDGTKYRMTPEAFQSLTTSVGILCHNSTSGTTVSPFLRADFVSSVAAAVSKSTFASKQEASSVSCAFFFMISGLLSSKKMTVQDLKNTINESNTNSFRVALTRMSQYIDSELAFQYFCSVVHSLWKFDEQAGKSFFDVADDGELIAIFCRCALFASTVKTAASFGKAMVSLVKSGSSDVKTMQQKFTSPAMVNAIVAVARSIVVADEVYSSSNDDQHSSRNEETSNTNTNNVTLANAAVKSISSVIISIVTNNGEGQRLFGTPEFANCWGSNLARWAGDDEATYLCCNIITEISTSSITRPFFAIESVVSGFADHLSRNIVNDHTASKFGGAIALLCYKAEECKRTFSRVSVFDAFVRILENNNATARRRQQQSVSASSSSSSNSQLPSEHQSSSQLSASSSSASVGSSATSVHHLCMAVSRLVWNEGPGRDAFSQCPRIVDDFIFVIAPHAKGLSVASQWLFSLIANTAINENNRRLYFLKEGNEEKLIDLFFLVAPSCRSGEAVYHFCRAFHNLCIEERIRDIFFVGSKAGDRMKQLIKIYTDFTRFVFTKDSAALWARSIVELIHENSSEDDQKRRRASALSSSSSSSSASFFLNAAFKNALCAAIFVFDSAFLQESESALWYLKLVEILFLKNNNNNNNTSSGKKDNNNTSSGKKELLTTSFKRAFDTFAESVSRHVKAKVVDDFARCGNRIQQELENSRLSSSLKNDDDEVNALVKDILSREI